MNAILRSPPGQCSAHWSDRQKLEALSISLLRLWADGQAGRARMTAEIYETIGPQRGHRIVTLWAEFIEIYGLYQQDPSAPHAIYEDYLSIDEAYFAQFLAIAAEGDREEALLLAMSRVRPDAVLVLTNLATQIGLSLKQILLIRSATNRPLSQNLH